MEEKKSMNESPVEDLKRKAGHDEEEEINIERNDCEPPVVKCAKIETAASVKQDEGVTIEEAASVKPDEGVTIEEAASVKPDEGVTIEEQKNENDNVTSGENEERAGETKVTAKEEEVLDSRDESVKSNVLDPLGYTKAEEFTSEIFKIQIHNLPKFGFSQLKKRLISLGLKPHKFKSPKQQVTYVCFRNDVDRQDALTKINGHVWKGRTLEAKEAAPAADPFLQKKQQQRNQDKNSTTTDSLVTAKREPLTPEEAEKRLKDSVVPLWAMDYTTQLQTKTEAMRSVLKSMTHNYFVREQFRQKESWKKDGMPCPLLPIIPSPVTSEYRNKNEFTIGFTADGKTVKVGFRYGLYKDGTTTVGDATGLGVVKPNAIPVIESFEKFVSKSKWLPFLQQTGSGHWHTLTVRTFDTGDVMAMVDFHPRKLDKSEIESAKNSVKEFYTNGDGKDLGIKSFYFRLHAKGPEGLERLGLIFGEQYVYESLLDLHFRISPEAFFQVNTKATEKLYRLIGEWCEFSESSTVLDICCGTGTIGLSMAKKVKHVIGIEMCQPAVDDAKANASLNDISNTLYYSSKVEDVIGKVLASVDISSSSSESTIAPATGKEGDIIAVVDPPRAGLHKSVIKTLRKAEEIRRLVYVSCNAQSAMENFVDLIRPSTGKLKGPPFSLDKAVPVDLFPGTRHCELVLLFTR